MNLSFLLLYLRHEIPDPFVLLLFIPDCKNVYITKHDIQCLNFRFSNKWSFKLRDLLNLKWGNGFFRVVDISNDTHRLNAIRYCFKQIDVRSNSDLMQALVDTWSITLVQTFEALKKAEIARLEEYKAANGLTTFVKNIAIQNRAISCRQ